jgi:hypothetical protein
VSEPPLTAFLSLGGFDWGLQWTIGGRVCILRANANSDSSDDNIMRYHWPRDKEILPEEVNKAADALDTKGRPSRWGLL